MEFPQIVVITNFGMRLSWKGFMRARNCKEISKTLKMENKRHRRMGIFYFFLQHLIVLLKQLYIGFRHLELTRIVENLHQLKTNCKVISAAL